MASPYKKLRDFLAQGRLEQALESLANLTEHSEDNDLRQRILALSGQFSNLKRENHKGMLDPKDYKLQWNLIMAATIDVAENLREKDSANNPTNIEPVIDVPKEERTDMTPIIICAVLLLLGFLTWKIFDKNVSKPISNERYIVVLDVSVSIAGDENRRISDNIYRLAGQLGEKSELILFTVNDNVFAPPVFKLLGIYKEASIIDRKKYQDEMQAAVDTIVKISQTRTKNSCIINSFKAVSNLLNRDTSTKQTHLLIFSDMVECCDFGCPQEPKDFKLLTAQIDKYRLSEYQLVSKIPLENFWIVMNSNGEKIKNTLHDSQEFNDFWTVVVKKLGYPQKQSFTQDANAFLERMDQGN